MDTQPAPQPVCTMVDVTLMAQKSVLMIKSQANNTLVTVHTFLILINTDKLPSSKAAPINALLRKFERVCLTQPPSTCSL